MKDEFIKNLDKGLFEFSDRQNKSSIYNPSSEKDLFATEDKEKILDDKNEEIEDKEGDIGNKDDSALTSEDFDKLLDEFDKVVGLSYLKCIHVNDSKNVLGAHKDRHENFGFGEIGFDTLINIIYNPRLDGVVKILETPYVTASDDDKKRAFPPYKFEIDMIKEKKFNPELIELIRSNYK